jgi:Holliday junction resolvasome RuvABC DNA-binding subunit
MQKHLSESIAILTSIKGVGIWKANVILAYCGSLENAARKGSLLHLGKIPGIGKKSTKIFNHIKNI